MAGIVFYQTDSLDDVASFYRDRVGMGLWLDQGVCRILRHGNMLLGFCSRTERETGSGASDSAGLNRNGCADTTGVITFFFPRTDDVDRAYRELADVAVSEPRHNERIGIYHFYAKDPEGRDIEFQCFEHPIDWEFLREG
jgi:hypothetical protein